MELGGQNINARAARTPVQRGLVRLYRHAQHIGAGSGGWEREGLAAQECAAGGEIVAVLPKSQSNYSFKNWAEIHTCKPKAFFKPTTVQEIVAIVKHAKKTGEKVKVIGAGHSPTDCSVTEGYMVSLQNLNRVVSADSKSCVATVEAGITLGDLAEQLAEYEIGLPNLSSIAEQSIAGAIATGTHGTGIGFGILATMITDLEFVTADGEVIKCSKEKHPELFNANLCCLGAVGIITKVTLKLEPLFNLHAVASPMKLEPMLKNLNTLIQSSEHVRIWWIPHTETCWVWRANRTRKPPTPLPRFRLLRYLYEAFTFRKLYEFLLWLATFNPRIIPLINKAYRFLLFRRKKEVIDRGDKLFTFDCMFRQYVSEWAVDLSNTATAVLQLRELIKQRKFNVHFAVEIRFSKADDIWLSPSYGRDSAWIGIIMYRPYGKDTPGTVEYFDAFEELMTSLGGRPHWAKAFKLSDDDFREIYPRWDAWKSVREQVDPTRMFSNAYLARIFGD